MKHFYLRHILLCLCLLAGTKAFAYDALIDGIYYNFSGNEAIVTYESYQKASYSGVVSIPKSVSYNGKTYHVTGIGDYAFYGCTELTTAILHFGDSLIYNKNLVVNGDFSSGNVGFTSDYVYINETGARVMFPEGLYAVGTSPNDYLDPEFMVHGDHTTGTGNMLIVNGSPNNQEYVWKQKFSVEKGKTYEFSAWLMNIDIYSIGIYSRFSNEFIEYSIDGTAILGTYDETENDWERFYGRYTATKSGEIEIKIRTVSEVLKGNDFAIDDISFSEMSSYTATKASIGNYAFANCSKLDHVYCDSKMVPDTQHNTFEGSNIKSATLLVPLGSVNLYEVVSPWNNFRLIQAVDNKTMVISTAQELATFANLVNAGNNDIDAMLIADIDFTGYSNVMIGSEYVSYRGDFNGAGHSVALNLKSSSDKAALFSSLSGNVHDLTTSGTITTSAKFAAGIAALTENATIERCQSKVNIVSTVNGDGTHGGIVGVSREGTIIRDCLVSGSINGSQTSCCGGVSGWAEGKTHISNCLVTGRFSVSTEESDMLSRNNYEVVSSNNYFFGNWNAYNYCGCTLLTKEQLTSGEACFLLNAERRGDETAWYQTLGIDAYPVPDNTHKMVVYDVRNGYHNSNYTINDETISFQVAMKGTGGTVVYTHEFSGEWESLYLPFAIDYDVIRDDFELAEIDGIVQNDDNNDGVADITVLSIIGFNGQATEPNMPYLIRAKNAGKQTIVFENVTVYPTEQVTFDCSSFSTKYEFTGSYNTLNNLALADRYVIQDGELVTGASSLSPCRWYMTATARKGMLNLPNRIRIMPVEDVITGVSRPSPDPSLYGEEIYKQGSTIVNLVGQQMVNGKSSNGKLPQGIYIVNGKKVVVK